MDKLDQEEEDISREMGIIVLALSNQDKSADMDHGLLQKYISLVDMKNSKVRQQMQLSIAANYKAVEHKMENIQCQLQRLVDLDDSLKTEDMRLEEEDLLKQYLEAVNEKDQLVQDLDKQEHLIADDERIRSNMNLHPNAGKSKVKASFKKKVVLKK